MRVPQPRDLCDAEPMGLIISNTELAKIPYVDLATIGDRTLYLLPLWDGVKWHIWVPQSDGSLLQLNPRDAVHTDYLAKQPASSNDLPVLFLNFIWQRASVPKVHGTLTSLLDDFHSLATSIAKIDHFAEQYEQLGFGSTLFVATELVELIRSPGLADKDYAVFELFRQASKLAGVS